jgi:hypothetical protein
MWRYAGIQAISGFTLITDGRNLLQAIEPFPSPCRRPSQRCSGWSFRLMSSQPRLGSFGLQGMKLKRVESLISEPWLRGLLLGRSAEDAVNLVARNQKAAETRDGRDPTFSCHAVCPTSVFAEACGKFCESVSLAARGGCSGSYHAREDASCRILYQGHKVSKILNNCL